MYRIADTSLGVAMGGSGNLPEKLYDGVGGTFNRARRPKTLAHFGQAGAKLVACGSVSK